MKKRLGLFAVMLITLSTSVFASDSKNYEEDHYIHDRLWICNGMIRFAFTAADRAKITANADSEDQLNLTGVMILDGRIISKDIDYDVSILNTKFTFEKGLLVGARNHDFKLELDRNSPREQMNYNTPDGPKMVARDKWSWNMDLKNKKTGATNKGMDCYFGYWQD